MSNRNKSAVPTTSVVDVDRQEVQERVSIRAKNVILIIIAAIGGVVGR